MNELLNFPMNQWLINHDIDKQLTKIVNAKLFSSKSATFESHYFYVQFFFHGMTNMKPISLPFLLYSIVSLWCAVVGQKCCLTFSAGASS